MDTQNIHNQRPDSANKKKWMLGLEEIVHISNKVGLAYVTAKKKAEHLELLSTIRAKVALRLDNGR